MELENCARDDWLDSEQLLSVSVSDINYNNWWED